MKVIHWTIQAYDSMDDKEGLHNVMIVDIDRAIDEKHAIEQAKKIITRPCYRVAKVSECHTCNNRLNEEMRKEMLKMLKEHNKEIE